MTATVRAPVAAPPAARPVSATLAGARTMVRFVLRRNRVRLTVWAVAYQYACDSALLRAQQMALQPPNRSEYAYSQSGKTYPVPPTTEPVSCIAPEDFDLDD